MHISKVREFVNEKIKNVKATATVQKLTRLGHAKVQMLETFHVHKRPFQWLRVPPNSPAKAFAQHQIIQHNLLD